MTEQEIEKRIAGLEAEVAPFKKWTRWDWFELRMYESRKRTLEILEARRRGSEEPQ